MYTFGLHLSLCPCIFIFVRSHFSALSSLYALLIIINNLQATAAAQTAKDAAARARTLLASALRYLSIISTGIN
jgi:hypothetical protein